MWGGKKEYIRTVGNSDYSNKIGPKTTDDELDVRKLGMSSQRLANVIPPEKQDKTLDEKLFSEREGIVQQAIFALGNVIRNGYAFTEPDSVVRCRNTYRNGNSTVFNFFYDCMCQKSDHYDINEDYTVTQIYKTYKEYCKINNNGYPKTRKDFDRDLSEILNCTPQELTTRRNNGIVYIDYTLTREARDAYYRS